jgi:hypothetical protein
MAKFGASTTFGRTLSYSKPGARDDDNAGSWCVSAGASITTTHFVRNSVGPTSPVGTVFSAGHRFIHTIDASGVMTTYVDGVASATVVSVGNWVDGGTMRFGVDTTTAYWGGIVAEYGVKTNFTDAAGVAAFDAALKTKWGL